MNYLEHLNRGRELPQEQLENDVQSLARDERFSAVVGWLDRNREKLIREWTKPGVCETAGPKLAHAAGAVHAIHLLTAQLATLLDDRSRFNAPQEEGR
jgi:hypothetical protein